MKRTLLVIFGLLLLAMAAVAQDQFEYTTNADNSLTITGYCGTSQDVLIPSSIDGLTVTCIGEGQCRASPHYLHFWRMGGTLPMPHHRLLIEYPEAISTDLIERAKLAVSVKRG